MTAANFDPAKIAQFEKMVNDAMTFAITNGLPLSVVEAAMRDVLSDVEAYRLLNALRNRGARV